MIAEGFFDEKIDNPCTGSLYDAAAFLPSRTGVRLGRSGKADSGDGDRGGADSGDGDRGGADGRSGIRGFSWDYGSVGPSYGGVHGNRGSGKECP